MGFWAACRREHQYDGVWEGYAHINLWQTVMDRDINEMDLDTRKPGQLAADERIGCMTTRSSAAELLPSP